MTNPNEPAYPVEYENGMAEIKTMGLTKREEFAKAAMQGLLANSEQQKFRAKHELYFFTEIPALAIEYADHLIAALNKASEGRDGG